jgi:peptidyl-prolyl cis-trans isomerase C
MHLSRLSKNVSLLFVTILLGAGSVSAVAAASDQKVTDQKAQQVSEPVKPAEQAQASSDVVAKVNGAAINAMELRRAKKVMMAGQPGMQIPPDRQKEFDQQALSQIISAELLYQAGEKLKINDIEKQVDAKLAQSKTRFPTPEDFTKAIKELEMTEAELREYTRRDLIISNFIDQTIVPKITVTEEDIKKFYEQNPDKFNRPESVKASHILIGVDAKASVEEKKKARDKIEKLRKDIAGGADFAVLAKENSTCPSSQQGGDLGFFGKGQMVPAFEQSAFSFKPGEISDIVETQFGFHIIKVTDKKPAETIVLKEVRGKIEEFLKGQKISAAVNTFLTETKKTAKIDSLLK